MQSKLKLDKSQPHTVVIVTSTCRLPFARGRVGPGVYHFPGDQRYRIRTVYDKKQLHTAEIFFVAGDTEEALKTIANLKNGITVEPVFPTVGGASDPYLGTIPAVKVAGSITTSELTIAGVETEPETEFSTMDPALADALDEIGSDDEPVVVEDSEDKQ